MSFLEADKQSLFDKSYTYVETSVFSIGYEAQQKLSIEFMLKFPYVACATWFVDRADTK